MFNQYISQIGEKGTYPQIIIIWGLYCNCPKECPSLSHKWSNTPMGFDGFCLDFAPINRGLSSYFFIIFIQDHGQSVFCSQKISKLISAAYGCFSITISIASKTSIRDVHADRPKTQRRPSWRRTRSPPWPGMRLLKSWSGLVELKYLLVICYIAIENGPFIVDLPIENGDFP